MKLFSCQNRSFALLIPSCNLSSTNVNTAPLRSPCLLGLSHMAKSVPYLQSSTTRLISLQLGKNSGAVAEVSTIKRPRLKAMASRTGSFAGITANTAPLSGIPFKTRFDEVVVMAKGLGAGATALRRRVICRDVASHDRANSVP